MNQTELDIAFTHDMDGVHFLFAPPPVKTAFLLIRGRFQLPPPLTESPSENLCDIPSSRLSLRIATLAHQSRPLRPNSIQTIDEINTIVCRHNRQIRHIVLSGRGPSLHEMTEMRLRNTGLKDKIPESRLNQSKSASGWKEWQVSRLLSEGYKTVIHIDDDLRPAMRIARLGDNTLCYLVKNISNSPPLLRRGKVELPANIVPISSFQALVSDFNDRILSGLI